VPKNPWMRAVGELIITALTAPLTGTTLAEETHLTSSASFPTSVFIEEQQESLRIPRKKERKKDNKKSGERERETKKIPEHGIESRDILEAALEFWP